MWFNESVIIFDLNGGLISIEALLISFKVVLDLLSFRFLDLPHGVLNKSVVESW